MFNDRSPSIIISEKLRRRSFSYRHKTFFERLSDVTWRRQGQHLKDVKKGQFRWNTPYLSEKSVEKV